MGSGHAKCEHILSVNDALLWCALALVVSNHLPASLLSPELLLLDSSFGDTLGGLAVSLAGCEELSVVGWQSLEAFT
jgi:hypothetical protein